MKGHIGWCAEHKMACSMKLGCRTCRTRDLMPVPPSVMTAMNASGLNAVMEQDEIDDLAKELEEVTVGKAEENALRLREAAADNARKLKQE